MELKQLRYFLHIADLKSFSKAAVVLGLSQTVLSRQIKALEKELKAELFYRNGRGVVLSESGKLLLGYATVATESVDRASTEIASLASVPTGKVAVAMPPSIGWVLTAPLVRACREKFPKIALHVVDGFSGHVMEWLSNGRIDIGVLYNAARYPSLLTEPLLEDELILLGPPGDPDGIGGTCVPASRLTELPLILPARPHGLRVMIDTTLAQMGLVPRVELELDAMASTLSLVEEGIGYTVLSEAAVRPLVAAGRLRSWNIDQPVLKRELLLATSSQRPASTATRAVARLLRQQVRSLSAFSDRPSPDPAAP